MTRRMARMARMVKGASGSTGNQLPVKRCPKTEAALERKQFRGLLKVSLEELLRVDTSSDAMDLPPLPDDSVSVSPSGCASLSLLDAYVSGSPSGSVSVSLLNAYVSVSPSGCASMSLLEDSVSGSPSGSVSVSLGNMVRCSSHMAYEDYLETPSRESSATRIIARNPIFEEELPENPDNWMDLNFGWRMTN